MCKGGGLARKKPRRVPSGGRALVGCLIIVDCHCLFVVRYVRCQHPHLPLRAVARRQGGGAVSLMVVVKCGAMVKLLRGLSVVTWQVYGVVKVLTL
jgi:hypothetical protein